MDFAVRMLYLLMCLIMYFIVQQMSKDNQTKLEYELMKEKEKYSKESMEIIKRSNEEYENLNMIWKIIFYLCKRQWRPCRSRKW